MSKIIDNLNWRYATKIFDKTKKVSDKDLDEIIETFRLTPSSFGLQPWKLLLVDNKNLRDELKKHSWNQQQITDSSHLLIFASKTNLDDSLVDDYINSVSETTGKSLENLKGYEDMMKGYLKSLSDSLKKLWAHEQIFIALGSVINTLAQKHIDSCIIGGFDPKKYDEILGLDKESLSSAVVLVIGYRDPSDDYATRPKIRFKKDEVFKIIK